MIGSTRSGTSRRGILAGGAALIVGATTWRRAAAQGAGGADFAVFTELSPDTRPMKAGWNPRVFTNTDTRRGSAIACDFATGIVTLAPGAYHIAGLSLVAYNTGGEPMEMMSIRAPASAGYCRLRRADLAAGREAKAIDNADPSVLCIGSLGTANATASLFETYLDTDRGAHLVLEHQMGNDPQQIYLRIFVQNSKWHAMARISIRKVG